MLRRVPLTAVSFSLLAAVLLAACAPQPAPTTTPSVEVTPSASPASTPADVPAVAFGGDCDRALPADVVERELGGAATLSPPTRSIVSASPESAALLGGLLCSWQRSDGSGGYLGVSVFPAVEVDGEVADRWASTRCGFTLACEMGRTVGSLWIGVGVSREGDAYSDPGVEELASLESRAQRVIDVVGANAGAARATAAVREAGWWSLPPCSDVADAVSNAAGTALEAGFPGDSIPEGIAWEVLVAAGLQDWCSWYSQKEGSHVIVELYPQPGVGRPADTSVAVSGMQPTTVAGTDASWFIEDPRQVGDFVLVTVAGANRLTVRFAGASSAEAVRALAGSVVDALGRG